MTVVSVSGFGRHSEQTWKCPFCNKGTVKVYFREGYIRSKASSISAGKKYTKYKVDDKIEEIGNNCPICGRSGKEIKRVFETGLLKDVSHEERLKRLKKAGLPTKVISKRNFE